MNACNQLPPKAEVLIKATCRKVAVLSLLYTLLPLSVVAGLVVLPAVLGVVSPEAAAALIVVTLLLVARRFVALLIIERQMNAAEISDEEKAEIQGDPRAVGTQEMLREAAQLLKLSPPDMVYRSQSEEHLLQVFVPYSKRHPATVFVDKGFLDLGLAESLLRTALAHELGHFKVRTGRWFSWYMPLVRRVSSVAVPLSVALLCVSLLSWGWLWMIPAAALAYYGGNLLLAIYSARVALVHEHGADAIADAVALSVRAEGGDNSVAALVRAMIKAVLKDDPELQLVREAPTNPTFKEWLAYNLMELLADHPHPDERIARSLLRLN